MILPVVFPQQRQRRQAVFLYDPAEHLRKAAGVADLVLHVVIALEHRIAAVGVGLQDGIPIFEMILCAAEGKIGVLLQRLRQRGEGLILQTVCKLAAQDAVFRRFDLVDDLIGLDLVQSLALVDLLPLVLPFDQYRLFMAR